MNGGDDWMSDYVKIMIMRIKGLSPFFYGALLWRSYVILSQKAGIKEYICISHYGKY